MVARKQGAVKRGAFTLMEMLVVVAIIVVLAGASGVIYFQYLEGAREDTARSKAKSLQEAAEAYRTKHGSLPESLREMTQDQEDRKATLDLDAVKDPWGGEYKYDANGTRNNGRHPDVWAEHDGKQYGNWPNQ